VTSDATQLTVAVHADDHVQGEASARLTLVEYGDYQCPACGAAYPLVKEVQQEYPRDVRFVFRNFPLTQIHPLAQLAAEIAEAAGTLGKFWPMHDWLYENQEQWSGDDDGGAALLAGARSLGLDEAALEAAVAVPKIAQRIKADFKSGIRSGVNGTPGFFVNGVLYTGVSPSLTRAIEAAIAEAHRR
jgi:protein-disulfide isomerase